MEYVGVAKLPIVMQPPLHFHSTVLSLFPKNTTKV